MVSKIPRATPRTSHEPVCQYRADADSSAALRRGRVRRSRPSSSAASCPRDASSPSTTSGPLRSTHSGRASGAAPNSPAEGRMDCGHRAHGSRRYRVAGGVRRAGMDAPPVGANRWGSLGARPRRSHPRAGPTRRSGLRDLHHAPAVCRRDRRTPPQIQRAAHELTARRSTHPHLHCSHETLACFVRLRRHMNGSRSALIHRGPRPRALLTVRDGSRC